MSEYKGEERRDLNACPVSTGQAISILSEIAILKGHHDDLKEDCDQLKEDIHETRDCLRNEIQILKDEIQTLRVSVANVQVDNQIKDSYIKGSLYGAKVGTKAGVVMTIIVICGVIISAVLTLHSIVTGRLDILSLFKW